MPLNKATVNDTKPMVSDWNINFSMLSKGGKKDTDGDKRCWRKSRASHNINHANSVAKANKLYANNDDIMCKANALLSTTTPEVAPGKKKSHSKLMTAMGNKNNCKPCKR